MKINKQTFLKTIINNNQNFKKIFNKKQKIQLQTLNFSNNKTNNYRYLINNNYKCQKIKLTLLKNKINKQINKFLNKKQKV